MKIQISLISDTVEILAGTAYDARTYSALIALCKHASMFRSDKVLLIGQIDGKAIYQIMSLKKAARMIQG